MPSCPCCAEPIAWGVVTCPLCGETLRREDPVVAKRLQSRGHLGLALGLSALVLGLFCVAPAVAIYAFRAPSPSVATNDDKARETMWRLAIAQVMFRNNDEDGDGLDDYASSLAELSDAGLIDAFVGAELSDGYAFDLSVSALDSSAWIAVAAPLSPGVSGDACFVVNHDGVVYESLAPFTLTPDASIPAGATPAGQ